MSTPSPLSGFILAGGHSVRLGRDKAQLDWHGQPLLEHMVGLLSMVCDPVRIVGRGELLDITPNLGPIGGLLTALHASTTDLNLVIAVDLPLLTSRFLKYFKDQCVSSPRDLVVCRTDSGFPLCFGARLNLKTRLAEYISSGERSLHRLIASVACEVIDTSQSRAAGFSDELFININTDADYKAALKVR